MYKHLGYFSLGHGTPWYGISTVPVMYWLCLDETDNDIFGPRCTRMEMLQKMCDIQIYEDINDYSAAETYLDLVL